jgi:hypothetical protein
VSINPAHREMYSMQHYVIKFVSDLRQVGSFIRVHLLKVPLNTITLALSFHISITLQQVTKTFFFQLFVCFNTTSSFFVDFRHNHTLSLLKPCIFPFINIFCWMVIYWNCSKFVKKRNECMCITCILSYYFL